MKTILYLAVMLTALGCSHSNDSEPHTWAVKQNGNVLEIAYGSGTDYPQYAALHLDSSYFRMNYGRESGWGTSVVLTPSLWAGGNYFQGANITATWKDEGADLLIKFSGTVTTLAVEGEVRLLPPANNLLSAQVSVSSDGNVVVDNRPGEAFKPVMLSSMHISSDQWDAQSAYAGLQTYAIPENGWIISPSVNATVLGFNGGTSLWKTNAPTVEIVLGQEAPITGWVTNSGNPNDDNLGLWAATDVVLANWTYTINTKAP